MHCGQFSGTKKNTSLNCIICVVGQARDGKQNIRIFYKPDDGPCLASLPAVNRLLSLSTTDAHPLPGWAVILYIYFVASLNRASTKFFGNTDKNQPIFGPYDLPKKQMSGLFNGLRILEDIKGIDIIYLSGEDVVRHKLVKDILKAYGDIQ